ncbi:glycosyltransferase family 2 protein [Methanocorpusculum labreanum]|nr:TIGR00180 family glycosyltransferase [Methanocorpusculum labreanum]
MREPDFVDECYADKDLSLLKKLTLVIPTYNRNYYLSRCLWYHAHFPFGEIIVADSSPEEKKVVNRETVAKVREMFGANVRYLAYEPETEKYGGDIYRKWGDAVQHVETEYSQICTDKEFQIVTTLCKCIHYLESHLDYTVAGGGRYHLEFRQKRSYTLTSFAGTIVDKDGWKRLQQFISSSGFTLLSIHRSKKHKEIYLNMICNNQDDLRFGEVYLDLLDVIFGKIYNILDLAITYRDQLTFNQTNSFSQKNQESSSFRYQVIWAYPNSEFDSKWTDFKNGIRESLFQEFPDDLCDIEHNLEPLLQHWLNIRLTRPNPIRKPLRIIYQICPDSLKLFFQKVFIQRLNPKKYFPIDENNPEVKLICQIIETFQWV